MSTRATLQQYFKNAASAGTPEAIGSGMVDGIKIKAQKARGAANTGNVYVGYLPANDSQLEELTPGMEISITAQEGRKIDLSKIYIDAATDGDGVLVTSIN
jgi:hypothetical protein